MLVLDVPYLKQSFDFDCWYACLRMTEKYRSGPSAEPLGLEVAEMEGMMRRSERDAFGAKVEAEGGTVNQIKYRRT